LHYADCSYTAFYILYIFMLSVIMLNVVMLSVVAPMMSDNGLKSTCGQPQ
jgi:hypothetical protein